MRKRVSVGRLTATTRNAPSAASRSFTPVESRNTPALVGVITWKAVSSIVRAGLAEITAEPETWLPALLMAPLARVNSASYWVCWLPGRTFCIAGSGAPFTTAA